MQQFIIIIIIQNLIAVIMIATITDTATTAINIGQVRSQP